MTGQSYDDAKSTDRIYDLWDDSDAGRRDDQGQGDRCEHNIPLSLPCAGCELGGGAGHD